MASFAAVHALRVSLPRRYPSLIRHPFWLARDGAPCSRTNRGLAGEVGVLGAAVPVINVALLTSVSAGDRVQASQCLLCAFKRDRDLTVSLNGSERGCTLCWRCLLQVLDDACQSLSRLSESFQVHQYCSCCLVVFHAWKCGGDVLALFNAELLHDFLDLRSCFSACCNKTGNVRRRADDR